MFSFYLMHEYYYAVLGTVIACIIFFSFNSILFLMWVVVLFKSLIQLRRKVKYSTAYIRDQDTHLEALNTKVEYHKFLFLFAIVFIELVSSILSIVLGIELSIYKINDIMHQDPLKHQEHIGIDDIDFNLFNFSFHIISNFENDRFNCNGIHSIPGAWEHFNNVLPRVIEVSFGMSFLLVFPLVYTLMSYYAMVIRNSLNYNSSMKSVEFAREQKALILGSFLMLLILLLLLVRIELFILFEFFQICIVFAQLVPTYYYSRRLIRVFNWKILDTKIAFGTDNYQFISYTKSLRHFKRFLSLYFVCMVSFCIYIFFKSINNIAIFIHPDELNRVFGFCPPLHQNAIHLYVRILIVFVYITSILQTFPLMTCFICFMCLNLSTIPYLLSRIHISCHFKLKFPKIAGSRDLTQIREPLLS